jgi:hypothetical protein
LRNGRDAALRRSERDWRRTEQQRSALSLPFASAERALLALCRVWQLLIIGLLARTGDFDGNGGGEAAWLPKAIKITKFKVLTVN